MTVQHLNQAPLKFLLQPLTYIHASRTTRLFRSEKAPHMIALSLTLGNHRRASHLSGVLSACGRDAYQCAYAAVVYITGGSRGSFCQPARNTFCE